MTEAPTPADRPADQLRAAAVRARETGDPLHTAVADLLDITWSNAFEADHEECRSSCSPETCDLSAALAVARQLLGTTVAEGVAPSADRRDRYAAAMALRDGHPEWPVRYEDDERDYRRRADAVMAVADAEQAALRAEAEGLDEALRGLISASEKDGARLRTELDKLIRWHKEDGAQAAKAATTIKRLRSERAELSRQLDCLRGDMRDMESSLREQDAEFERIRRLTGEAAPPAPADRAAVLREAADLVATYTGNSLDANAKMLRRAADEAAARVQPPTTGRNLTARWDEATGKPTPLCPCGYVPVACDADRGCTPPAAPAAPEETQ
ncbi:hypothetical protein [Streptomyces sp. NPDC018055]|uniref:hypothetical protein n=1 Tax=Streptomyces sp. NPDC018055 TaxID=3365038 RepID=UPI0037A14A35